MRRIKKFIPFVILLSTFFCTLNAENIYESKFNASSEYIMLNGDWHFKFDPQDAGIKEGWQNENSRINWDKIEVPSTYNIVFPDKKFYFGSAWYKKTFKITQDKLSGHRVILHINSAGLRSQLWVNGVKAASHNSAYTDFIVEITDLIKADKDNSIVVRTDNKIDKKTVPDRFGWWPYGGLYRDVYLEIVPQVAIENIWMKTNFKRLGEWRFSVNCLLNNPLDKKGAAELEFSLKDGEKVIWHKKEKYDLNGLKLRLSTDDTIRNVKAWTPNDPKLYDLTVTVKESNQLHSKSIKTAFREIKVEGSKIYLNNRPLVIKGINYHEDHPDYGNALPKIETEKDLRKIKALGVNLIRGAHYMHDQYFYDLCDKMGFLVWGEIPAWQTSVKLLADPSIWERYLLPQLSDMVSQYRQHPSIIIWSVGNEFDSRKKEALEYVRKSVNYIRSLDDTRLVTFASDKHKKGNDDICFGEVDFIAINEYYGWYYGTLYDAGKALDRLHRKYADKPIVVSEFNAGAALDSTRNDNYCAVSGKQYTLEYQNKFLSAHLDQIYFPERQDYVCGGIIWLYNDFADVHRSGGGHPKQWNYVNLKGLVNQHREHKPSFELVERYFNCIKEPIAQLSKILITQSLPGYVAEHNNVSYPIGKKDLKWRKAKMSSKNAVDLIGQVKPDKDCHIYAATEIITDKGINTTLLFGRNDGAALWLNGELIYENLAGKGFIYNEFAIPVKLKKGKNLLVLLLSQSGGGWKFNFNLNF